LPDAIAWSLHDKTAVIEQQRTQAGQAPLAPAGPSRATVQTTGYHIAVPSVLTANRRIHDQHSSMKVANTKDCVAGEIRII